MVNLFQPQTRKTNLLLHCGNEAVARTVIAKTITPKPTATWTPIPHMHLIEEVERALKANNLSVVNQAHSLNHGGSRYFGLMEIRNGSTHADYSWVLGLRNSHDKTFPAGIVAGAQVFVCDNLSFSGEIKIARKHTRFILRDMPFLTQQAIGRLMERWHHQDERISAYKTKAVSDRVAHVFLPFRFADKGDALEVGKVPRIEFDVLPQRSELPPVEVVHVHQRPQFAPLLDPLLKLGHQVLICAPIQFSREIHFDEF